MNAGTLTLTKDGQPFETYPSGGTSYIGRFGPGRPWDGGETFGLFAEGGIDFDSVEAFHGAAIAPEPVNVTSPGRCDASCPAILISENTNLALAWTGGTHGDVRARLSTEPSDGGTDGGPGTLVECWFPMASGAGVIPASALAHLPAGAKGHLEIRPTNDRASQFIMVDGGVVRFELVGDSKWSGEPVDVIVPFTVAN